MNNLVYQIVIGMLTGMIGFLLTREFSGRDKMIQELRNSIETLQDTNKDLTDLIHEMRAWALEQFMRRVDFEKEHETLEDRIIARIELHERTCIGAKRC